MLEWLCTYVRTHVAIPLVNPVVTLFELMVVNNWWIIMEGFHLADENKDSRAFFICFHLSTVVCYHVHTYIHVAIVHTYVLCIIITYGMYYT